MPRKIKQYAGIGSQGEIYIEKRPKIWKGDPAKLEQDWKSTQQENSFLRDQVAVLEAQIASFATKEAYYEAKILAEQKAHGETIKKSYLTEREREREREQKCSKRP